MIPLLIFGLYFIVLIAFVKDIEILIFDDRFEICHYSVIQSLNNKEIFMYKDITHFKFDKAFSNIVGGIIESIFGVGYLNQTQSKSDTIEIKLKDSPWRVINRIGSKKNFRKASKIILLEYKKQLEKQ